MQPPSKEIREYETQTGKAPFKEWLFSLRDIRARARIIVRLKRLSFGLYGDCQNVGEGVRELRIHTGPGYRVYFSEVNDAVILLWGGDKSTQDRDIQKAQHYWADFRGRQ